MRSDVRLPVRVLKAVYAKLAARPSPVLGMPTQSGRTIGGGVQHRTLKLFLIIGPHSINFLSHFVVAFFSTTLIISLYLTSRSCSLHSLRLYKALSFVCLLNGLLYVIRTPPPPLHVKHCKMSLRKMSFMWNRF